MESLAYLGMYKNKHTVRQFQSALKKFFSVQGFGGDSLEQSAEMYLKEQRDYRTDVGKFIAEMNGEYAPKTVHAYLSAVKTFLIENDLELSQRDWRRLIRRVNGSMARTMDSVPRREEFRTLLMHMPIQGKTFYLTLISSGIRIGEALQVELDDLDLEEDPARISLRGEYTKSGDPRIVFISDEAKEHIKEWLKWRREYLISASKKTPVKYDKSVDDSRLFPFNFTNAHYIWKTALRKTGLDKRDKSTNRYKLHPHSLRKFFRTQMATAIPVDIVEALMGHKGYLTKAYRRYTVEQLADFYKEGEVKVTIFGKSEEVEGVSKLKEIIANQKKDMDMLTKKFVERVEEIEKKFNEREKKLKNFLADYEAQMSDAGKEGDVPAVTYIDHEEAESLRRKNKEYESAKKKLNKK